LGMKLVGKQLQWVLGANPFGQSLMYGIGYDFPPHFAYCLKDIVGSLPVGMDCMSGDEPFWSATNTATYKEIWMEPVSRFLGAVSIYASQDQSLSEGEKPGKRIKMHAETIHSDNGDVVVTITLTGTGRHEVDIKTFNAKADSDKHQIDLSGGEPGKIELNLNVADKNKPYIAVICVDKDPDLRKEIVGSFINAPFSDKE